MEPSKEQVVHDLAMACVYGVIQSRVKEEYQSGCPIITAEGLAVDAIVAYKEAYEAVDSQIEITDE